MSLNQRDRASQRLRGRVGAPVEHDRLPCTTLPPPGFHSEREAFVTHESACTKGMFRSQGRSI